MIICRCESICEETIRSAIQELGARSQNEVKLVTRAGKGICQARCCGELVAQIVCDETGLTLEQLPPPSSRPPVRAIPMVQVGSAPDIDGRLNGNVLTLQMSNEEAIHY